MKRTICGGWSILQVVLSLILIGGLAPGCEEDETGEGQGRDVTEEIGGASTSDAPTSTATTPSATTARGPNIERTSEPGRMSDLFPLYGSRDRVEQTMAAVAGAKKMEGSTPREMEYRGGRFLEYPVRSWAFGFFEDQMTYTQLQLSTDEFDPSLEDAYEEMSREMNRRYGDPVFDSDRQVSRQLDRYSDEEIAFIEKVGLSLKGGRFRFWTPTDSTADMLTTLHMIPQDPTLTNGYIHLAWYDRAQSVADLRAAGIFD